MSTTGTLNRFAPAPRRHALTRKHCWMLLLAFEILVAGFTQSLVRPARQAGISIEISVTPNHVVT
ncbi:hypothetical protein ACLBX9_22410 [Methylobacterium sp. A49B]